MCVIAFSPKGVDIPTKEQLKQMWEHNPDGAGYAYVSKKGKVVYKKGFMTLEALTKELEAPERFKNTNFAIHFRIGTSGKNDAATCHPFPLSTNFGELRKEEGETDSVLFHNGVLSSGGIISPLASDTQDFVVAMAPLLEKYNRSKARDFFIGELTKGSRLLILYKNNKFKMFGDWKQDGDIWVSNTNYKNDYQWYGDYYYGCRVNEYYADDYYGPSDYYGYHPTSTVAKSEGAGMSEEAAKLFAKIIRDEWAHVTPEEIDMLKRESDGYDEEVIEIDGYIMGYSVRQGIIWLEETPLSLDEELIDEALAEEELKKEVENANTNK